MHSIYRRKSTLDQFSLFPFLRRFVHLLLYLGKLHSLIPIFFSHKYVHQLTAIIHFRTLLKHARILFNHVCQSPIPFRHIPTLEPIYLLSTHFPHIYLRPIGFRTHIPLYVLIYTSHANTCLFLFMFTYPTFCLSTITFVTQIQIGKMRCR